MDNLWGLKLLVDHEKFNGNVPPGQSFYDLKQTFAIGIIFNCILFVPIHGSRGIFDPPHSFIDNFYEIRLLEV